ncbi:NUC153 and WD40 repeat-containing nucleolar rRNA processing-related protein [Fistulina hepatica ATCC 64428]|uniref:NUC153 and WD40 repeat-containing nucleolar rRNA processing-related protein n=1 Tax=Fistulina hepatica ATCC 64428 TaxID=1128425 RepID=A0A0D7A201_9AGAR|nr:NUC153 and WD40 repeat-containing nucleolar rRNA processing-related protein [Fistulina hepatica ATCC 64428]
MSSPDYGEVKIYTVNGAPAGSSSSLPDWLTRKRAKGKGKRTMKERIEGTVELIQGFEFPEASNRIKTTPDGHHAMATGTYKPQIKVWDLDQVTLKFERHSDAENVDFVILSDDWTKSIHLQNDRTLELHTQGGFHYRTRIPKFGRSIAYHFPSCDTYVTAAGNEVYRLNLDLGRFMTPLVLEDEGPIAGVNVVDINPAHQLLAFGVEGNGSVQLWDPRSRTSVGILRLPEARLSPQGDLSITAIASRRDGLSYAIGTSTGYTLLYDIRSTKHFALKDQGYGLPIKTLTWIEGGSRLAGDGLVLSADKKVIKIWDRSTPSSNFAAITTATDINDVHHLADSGLIMTANEGIQMSAYFIPQLGPAPRWASFLDNITEEMEDQTVRTIYEDYKFVERTELQRLGLDHLVGTPTVSPYMHGYFISLQLYDTARLIAKPFAYAEHRERAIQEKMQKQAEERIRTKKVPGVKVNRALAEKVMKEAVREEKRRHKKVDAPDGIDVDQPGPTPTKSLLDDARFTQVFEDPEFAIDETSREYALLNPSSVAQAKVGKTKTAVEEEEDESERSSDELEDESDSDSKGNGSSDSSDEGVLTQFDRRARPKQRNIRAEEAYARQRELNRKANEHVRMVPMRTGTGRGAANSADSTFGQRRVSSPKQATTGAVNRGDDGAIEMSWVPGSGSTGDASSNRAKKRGPQLFGVGLQKELDENEDMDESRRKGRTQRRQGVRSGSKKAFHQVHG